ncbi:MAG: DUF6516 family protein [Chloroflexota bacterium]|nr:DUF6516 family protein [Chloroflexota bacterium]
MDSQLVALGPIFERECRHVASRQVLPTKLRFTLEQGHICDLFFRSRTGGYSYTLVKDEQRVMGWDNARHHHHISTAPHHFHTPEGTISASPLVGDPVRDVIRVARAINHYLEAGASPTPVS